MKKIVRYYLLCLTAITAFSLQVTAQKGSWKEDLLQYINKNLSKSDGGYGWDDQPDSHLEPTFAVVGILNVINALPADRTALVDYIKKHHPQRQVNKETGSSGFDGRTLLYEQVQGTRWLGGDLAFYKPEVANMKTDVQNLYNYEKHHYGVIAQEALAIICADLLGLQNKSGYAGLPEYLTARRRTNGSFNNAPDSTGGDGNIINTYWALYAYQILEKSQDLKSETIEWLNSCQLDNGGFTHQPHAQIGANDDVAYTWAGVKALQILSAKPSNIQPVVNYLLLLRNADGGFGNRPGLPSTPMSTFYALDALKALDALSYLENSKPSTVKIKHPDLAGYKVYTVQFQAFGGGSPAEAVMLADSMKIQLWGAKNAPKGWIEAAQGIADKKKIQVLFFHADEPYGKDVIVEGMGNFGHILDNYYPAQAGISIPDSANWKTLSAGFLESLKEKKGGIVLQISNNEPLVRILLDESIKNGKGYTAISTIHFGQNFLFFLPFLYQYRHMLPFIALQDAHGIESWWWSNDLLAYRTLFLAKEPTYEGLLNAINSNLLVAARHDSLSLYKTRMLGGAPGVQQYILSQSGKWKWWNDANTELVRPWAAITVLNSKDSFEVASSDSAVVIRIRPWWDTNKQIMKSALVQLEKLMVDNNPVTANYIEPKDKRGAVTDSYYLYKITKPSPGQHIIQATLKNVKNNKVKVITEKISF